jgi:chemotaxis protein CheC
MDLTKRQIDALKEVGNVGAGHAATVLSQIVGHKVSIGISRVGPLSSAEMPAVLGGQNAEVVSVGMTLSEGVQGSILLLIPVESAFYLTDILTKKEAAGQLWRFSELDFSCLTQKGGILIAAYCSALSDMLRLVFAPVGLQLASGKVKTILDKIGEDPLKGPGGALCIETEFAESANEIKGTFLLIPEAKSLELILRTLGS